MALCVIVDHDGSYASRAKGEGTNESQGQLSHDAVSVLQSSRASVIGSRQLQGDSFVYQ
ncbi:UNVERIFIED_CONTAM: hypothetical protein FKN15_063879 [Acipenser sinensis]